MKRWMVVIAALCLIIPVYSLAATCSDKFVPGDTVMLTAYTVVYETPGRHSVILGRQPSRAYGKLIAGPVDAERYCWWYVDYGNGVDGWSYENYFRLIKHNSIPKILSIPIISEPVLSDIVNITGMASDEDGIQYVDVWVSTLTTIPEFVGIQSFATSQFVEFAIPLDTTLYPNGQYVITVYVYNSHGSASFGWWVEFNN